MFSQKMTLGIMCCMKGGGGSSGSGGGGGGSGKVSYSPYFEAIHSELLSGGDSNPFTHNESLCDAIAALWNNSPYADAYAYDPQYHLDTTQDRFDDYDAHVDTLDPEDQITNFITVALAQADRVINDTYLAAVGEGFETRQRAARARATARMNAGFADINAVMGSAFVLGNFLLENEHAADVARFNADLSLQGYRDRQTLITGLVSELMRALMLQTESQRTATTLQAELNRMRIVAMREYVDDELELSLKDATWNVNIFGDAGNLLAAGHGGVAGADKTARKETSGMSMLGGVISGAASGAMMGSAGGPWGMGIGAVVGGALGGFSS